MAPATFEVQEGRDPLRSSAPGFHHDVRLADNQRSPAAKRGTVRE
jgi:hypothetical protein